MIAPRLCPPLVAGLLALALAGCSGSSSDPDSPAAQEGTSVTQLCGALTDFQADVANADPADPATYAQALKAAATRLDAVGVPEEMPADAQAAFTAQVAAIQALPDDATADDLATVSQAAAAPALTDYLATACPTP